MTSQNPICFSDTESEPEEATFVGPATTVTRTESVHACTYTSSSSPSPSSSSSSSSSAESAAPTAPAPIPILTPAAATYEVGESSRRPKIRRTARKTVGRFPTRRLAARSESSASTRDIPCDVQTQRLPGPEPLHWMTTILPRWREAEELPSSFARHAPITGEPIELTVPTLVGVCRTIFQILAARGGELHELESDVSVLESDVITIYGRLGIARAHMRSLETRVRVLTVVVSAAVCWFLLGTIVGRLFSYFM